MKHLSLLTIVVLETLTASAAHVVRTGSIAEGGFGVATAETLTKDGCGTLLNLFHGKWTPEKVRTVGTHCRKHGCTFTMDEMFNRWSGDWKPEYASIYSDGMIYLLNTEAHLSQDVIVERSKGSAREAVRLGPGELKTVGTAKMRAPHTAATSAAAG